MMAETLPKISADRLTYTFRCGTACVSRTAGKLWPTTGSTPSSVISTRGTTQNYTNYYIHIAGAILPSRRPGRRNRRRAPQLWPSARERLSQRRLGASGDRSLHPANSSGKARRDLFRRFGDARVVRRASGRSRALGSRFAAHPVGCGPFVLTEWSPGLSLRLDRNPNYFRSGEPYLDGVDVAIGPDAATEIMMFERGELDYVPMVSSADYLRLKRSPTLRNCMYPLVGGDVIYISLNCELPPFNDAHVRRAMNYAVDKQRILKVMLDRGSVAHGLLTPVNKAYDEKMSPYPYDPDKAHAILAEAGYAKGFETQLVVASDSELFMKAALVVQRNLAAVGINVDLKKVQGPAVSMSAKTRIRSDGSLGLVSQFP